MGVQGATSVFLLGLVLGTAFSVQAQADAAQPSEGAASEDERAHDLFLRGDRLYSEGDYAGAIDAFKESYSLSGRTLLLFNLGNAYERSGQYERAIDALRRYAPSAPEYEHDSVARRINKLEDRIRAADGDTTADEAAPPSTPQAQSTQELPAPIEVTAGTSTLGWVLAISGGALIIGGSVAGVIALGARSDAEGDCMDGICSEASKGAIQRDATAAVVADVGLIGGAASLAVGVILILIAGSDDGAPDTRVAIDGDGVRLGYAGSF